MNIAVYAICRNQAAYVPRWCASMAEADGLYVLDIGSADGGPALLRRLGAQVTACTAVPWDRNAARNQALELIPETTDICVFTRLDEVFAPGWRSLLQQCWQPWTKQVYFPGLRYSPWPGRGPERCLLERIHARRDFLWQGPGMDCPTYTGLHNPATVYIPELQLLRLPIPPGPG